MNSDDIVTTHARLLVIKCCELLSLFSILQSWMHALCVSVVDFACGCKNLARQNQWSFTTYSAVKKTKKRGCFFFFFNAYHVVWFNTLLFDCNVFIGLDFCLVLFSDFIMITRCFIVELYCWFIYYTECNEMPYCISTGKMKHSHKCYMAYFDGVTSCRM